VWARLTSPRASSIARSSDGAGRPQQQHAAHEVLARRGQSRQRSKRLADAARVADMLADGEAVAEVNPGLSAIFLAVGDEAESVQGQRDTGAVVDLTARS